MEFLLLICQHFLRSRRSDPFLFVSKIHCNPRHTRRSSFIKNFFPWVIIFFHYVEELLIFFLLPVLVSLSDLFISFVLVTTKFCVFEWLLEAVTTTRLTYHLIVWGWLLVLIFANLRRFFSFRSTTALFEHCTFFFFLFVDELVINTIVQIGIIVLLINTILLSTLPCKFDNSSGYYHACYLFGPLKGFGFFRLDFLFFLWIFNKHRFYWVKWSQYIRFLFIVLLLWLLVFCIFSLQIMLGEKSLLCFLDLTKTCMSWRFTVVFSKTWFL